MGALLDLALSVLPPVARNEHPYPKEYDFNERAAIIEFDGQLDRTSAELCAHAIVFCHDCQHHMRQSDVTSRSGHAQATPSGCKLGLSAPDSWPPIYSFTGWCCPHHRATR